VTAPITSFIGEYRFLSNFYPLVHVDVAGLTVEHLFQAAKCVDPHQAQYVMDARSPGEAKRRGRRAVLREDWEEIKLPVMRLIVGTKFFSSLDLGQRLLETADAELVEGNVWHDNYWGVCACAGCVGLVPGQNHLGKILMDVRAQLHEIASRPT
jgi:ribA/ribD-fused uncharacterized protein